MISLDVSPSLDYMVCECMDGMLQLWSLHTGRLVWTRPVVVRSNTTATLSADKYVTNVSSGGILFHRSVVFHPTRECVLSGTLHQAYTIDGDLKPLFSESNCRFSVCSISGDKTKIITNYLRSYKCLVL